MAIYTPCLIVQLFQLSFQILRQIVTDSNIDKVQKWCVCMCEGFQLQQTFCSFSRSCSFCWLIFLVVFWLLSSLVSSSHHFCFPGKKVLIRLKWRERDQQPVNKRNRYLHMYSSSQTRHGLLTEWPVELHTLHCSTWSAVGLHTHTLDPGTAREPSLCQTSRHAAEYLSFPSS